MENNAAFPLPEKYILPLVPVCIRAIEEVNADRFETQIELPDGMGWTNSLTGIRYTTASASEIVRLLGLID